MNAPKYEVFEVDEYTVQFYSKGRNGTFVLRVIFTRFISEAVDEVYNLGFGIWNNATGQLDDLQKTNNGDSERILATVASTAIQFLVEHPNAFLYAEGSTAARTRRYQMGIAKYLCEVEGNFKVKGMIRSTDDRGNFDVQWHDFSPGTNYEAFLLWRK